MYSCINPIVDHLDDLAPALNLLDRDLAFARGGHCRPGRVEDLVELLERAPARLDAEEEPERGRAHVPDDEHEVVLVPPALEPDRVRERVDEPGAVRDQDVHCWWVVCGGKRSVKLGSEGRDARRSVEWE